MIKACSMRLRRCFSFYESHLRGLRPPASCIVCGLHVLDELSRDGLGTNSIGSGQDLCSELFDPFGSPARFRAGTPDRPSELCLWVCVCPHAIS